MPAPKLTTAEVTAELSRRWRGAVARVTPEAIASGKHGERHEMQIVILRCRAQNIIIMCSRRAGKSEVCCGLELQTAIATDDVSCLYLALTKDAAFPKRLGKPDIPATMTTMPRSSMASAACR
jgi:hypothetical protein